MPTPVIAVVGSAMMDLTAYTDVIPAPGQTVVGKNFVTGFGGKGANQSVISAKCGADVVFIGSVGNDSFGDSIIENFNSVGVRSSFVTRSGNQTSVAHITVDTSGENRIIIVSNADQQLDPNSVYKAIMSIPNLSAVVAGHEISEEVIKEAFTAAKEKDCVTILNPAPYKSIPSEILSNTDYLIPNETEFCEMQKIKSIDNYDFTNAVFTSNIIVTLGEKGAIFKPKTGEQLSVTAPKVNVVDTTGAGDAFVGSFVSALLFGADAKTAIKFAIEVASLSVTKAGAQSSYPDKSEIASLRKSLII